MAGDVLYLADTGNGRVLLLRIPALEICGEITLGLQRPTVLALDRQRRLYVLDLGTVPLIRRMLSDDCADTAFDRVMATHSQLTQPVSIALGEDDVLYVSERSTQQIHAFDTNGHSLGAFVATTPSMQPGALACGAGMLFAADAASGQILVFDTASHARLGVVPRWRGAVAAMVCSPAGGLYVKPDGGDHYLRLPAGKGRVSSGMLEAGPFDAGVERDWERLAVEVEMPPGTRVSVMACVQAAQSPAPASSQWQTLPSLDALLDRVPGPATAAPGASRYLWLQVRMDSLDAVSSPRLHQVHAQTSGVSYLEQLPRIYRRDDASTRFLERFLALARSTLQDWDDEIDAIVRRFDPSTTPAEHLQWLAGCMAFVPPQGLEPTALRTLIARLPYLYERRGTASGLRDLAEIFTGIRIQIFEAYRQRHLWQLGETSLLGFDTALPAATPDGWVVPGELRTDPSYAGLRGDYYAGANFDRRVLQRTDASIDFGNELTSISTPLTIRWSGQMQPRFDETYTFHVLPGQGVRLWVAGYPLIDTWKDAAPVRTSATLPEPLETGRWYPLVMELRHGSGSAAARLEWSSRSQRREVVSNPWLYSVLDEHANLANTESPACFIEVGNSVLGESRPTPASDFGATLFDDFAHLFTVVAPAGSCCDAGKREALRALIEAEKPAHTDFNLCFTEPETRVGNQARLGVDSVVAGGPAPMKLGASQLGADSFLPAEHQGETQKFRGRQSARLGVNSIVGKEEI
jgi:phage tail-like protein